MTTSQPQNLQPPVGPPRSNQTKTNGAAPFSLQNSWEGKRVRGSSSSLPCHPCKPPPLSHTTNGSNTGKKVEQRLRVPRLLPLLLHHPRRRSLPPPLHHPSGGTRHLLAPHRRDRPRRDSLALLDHDVCLQSVHRPGIRR